MLTKSDLDQLGQVIKKVVRQEIESEVGDLSTHLKAHITLTKIELKNDIGKLADRTKDIEIHLKEIGKRVKKIEKTVDSVIDHFDERTTKLETKVSRIESHLNLSSKN